MAIISPIKERSVHPNIVLTSILGFWLFYAALTALGSLLGGHLDTADAGWRGIAVNLIGIVTTWVLYLLLRPFEHSPLPWRAVIAFAATLPCALIISLFSLYAFGSLDPGLSADRLNASAAQYHNQSITTELFENTMNRYLFISAWVSIYLAISSATKASYFENIERELEESVRKSEILSLRYQINPKFLFDTMESIRKKIIDGDMDTADRMIISLSEFFRISLSGNTMEHIRLSDEIRLQKIYIDTENERIPYPIDVHIRIDGRSDDPPVTPFIFRNFIEPIIYAAEHTHCEIRLDIDVSQHLDTTRCKIDVSSEQMINQKEMLQDAFVSSKFDLTDRFGAQIDKCEIIDRIDSISADIFLINIK